MSEQRANIILAAVIACAAVASFLATSYAFGEMATSVYNARRHTTNQGVMGWGHYIPVVTTTIVVFLTPIFLTLAVLGRKTQKPAI